MDETRSEQSNASVLHKNVLKTYYSMQQESQCYYMFSESKPEVKYYNC